MANSNGAPQAVCTYTDDVSSVPAGTVYYRLEITDKMGTAANSSIVAIVIDKRDTRLAIYPNPAHHFMVVDNLPAQAKGMIMIHDLAGRTLITQA